MVTAFKICGRRPRPGATKGRPEAWSAEVLLALFKNPAVSEQSLHVELYDKSLQHLWFWREPYRSLIHLANYLNFCGSNVMCEYAHSIYGACVIDG